MHMDKGVKNRLASTVVHGTLTPCMMARALTPPHQQADGSHVPFHFKQVHIDKGMKNGSKVVLRGEAGCSEPGLAPGDIILLVQVR